MSKGADDRVNNEYGLTCYEGINRRNKLPISKRKPNQSAKELLKDSPKRKEKTHTD